MTLTAPDPSQANVGEVDSGRSFSHLPTDILVKIFEHAAMTASRPANIITLSRVSKQWRQTASEASVVKAIGIGGSAVKARQWGPEARAYLEAAAGAGSLEALFMLGMVLFYCLPNERLLGGKHIVQAGRDGHAAALYAASIISFNGSGWGRRAKDMKMGVALCCRAAALGNVDAMRELGHCLLDGFGARQDQAEGMRLLLLAQVMEIAAMPRKRKRLHQDAPLPSVAHRALAAVKRPLLIRPLTAREAVLQEAVASVGGAPIGFERPCNAMGPGAVTLAGSCAGSAVLSPSPPATPVPSATCSPAAVATSPETACPAAPPVPSLALNPTHRALTPPSTPCSAEDSSAARVARVGKGAAMSTAGAGTHGGAYVGLANVQVRNGDVGGAQPAAGVDNDANLFPIGLQPGGNHNRHDWKDGALESLKRPAASCMKVEGSNEVQGTKSAGQAVQGCSHPIRSECSKGFLEEIEDDDLAYQLSKLNGNRLYVPIPVQQTIVQKFLEVGRRHHARAGRAAGAPAATGSSCRRWQTPAVPGPAQEPPLPSQNQAAQDAMAAPWAEAGDAVAEAANRLIKAAQHEPLQSWEAASRDVPLHGTPARQAAPGPTLGEMRRRAAAAGRGAEAGAGAAAETVPHNYAPIQLDQLPSHFRGVFPAAGPTVEANGPLLQPLRQGLRAVERQLGQNIAAVTTSVNASQGGIVGEGSSQMEDIRGVCAASLDRFFPPASGAVPSERGGEGPAERPLRGGQEGSKRRAEHASDGGEGSPRSRRRPDEAHLAAPPSASHHLDDHNPQLLSTGLPTQIPSPCFPPQSSDSKATCRAELPQMRASIPRSSDSSFGASDGHLGRFHFAEPFHLGSHVPRSEAAKAAVREAATSLASTSLAAAPGSPLSCSPHSHLPRPATGLSSGAVRTYTSAFGGHQDDDDNSRDDRMDILLPGSSLLPGGGEGSMDRLPRSCSAREDVAAAFCNDPSLPVLDNVPDPLLDRPPEAFPARAPLPNPVQFTLPSSNTALTGMKSVLYPAAASAAFSEEVEALVETADPPGTFSLSPGAPSAAEMIRGVQLLLAGVIPDTGSTSLKSMLTSLQTSSLGRPPHPAHTFFLEWFGHDPPKERRLEETAAASKGDLSHSDRCCGTISSSDARGAGGSVAEARRGRAELAPGLQFCGRAGCGRPETRTMEFWRCSYCWQAGYCSRSCQLYDWRLEHSRSCRPAENLDYLRQQLRIRQRQRQQGQAGPQQQLQQQQ
eukprot:TRINITY_DN15812_c0_g1_i1.p1 TRINITY_DN15812_c0_g1~~TRINITY_DN15812_c0_g1_i1.p1  ORF type:complete len:1240 (+),score=229.75 TRINITY_DN15812_c0_g1_i1:811-4530(+)